MKHAETRDIFNERVQARADLIRKEPGDVEKVRKDLKECFLEEAVGVCGETRGIARRKETQLVVERGGCGLDKGEAAFSQIMERA